MRPPRGYAQRRLKGITDGSAEQRGNRQQADDLNNHLAAYFTICCRHIHLSGIHSGYLLVGNTAVSGAQNAPPLNGV
jgi:uncharacterized protein YutD